MRVTMKLSYSAALALGAVFSLSVACADPTGPGQPRVPGQPREPSQPAQPPTLPGSGSPASPGFPTLSKSGDIYNESNSIYAASYAYQGGSLVSRYVLYQDGTFALQFVSGTSGFFEYPGTYTREGTVVTFAWQGWSTAGPWGSSATLDGDSLTVTYNIIMLMTDFENGRYVKATTASP